jgi:hypothetical protein
MKREYWEKTELLKNVVANYGYSNKKLFKKNMGDFLYKIIFFPYSAKPLSISLRFYQNSEMKRENPS